VRRSPYDVSRTHGEAAEAARENKKAGPLADGPAMLSGEEGAFQRAASRAGVVGQLNVAQFI
jgi:hypothetical protein